MDDTPACRLAGASSPSPFLWPQYSYREDFHFRMNHLPELHLFDEVDHLVQAGIDMSPVIAHGTDAELGHLPEVLVSDLRNGHIEPMPHPVDYLPEDMAFPLERMIFRDTKVNPADSNNHAFLPRPSMAG
jgi:hypothetical protein